MSKLVKKTTKRLIDLYVFGEERPDIIEIVDELGRRNIDVDEVYAEIEKVIIKYSGEG